jgi:hypothetical protein
MAGYAKSLTNVYDRLEGNAGKTWDSGRDLVGIDTTEY